MKAPSTTTTLAGSSHHASVRNVAPGMTSPLWLPKARLSMRLVPRVLLHAVQVEIAAVTVVDDHGRESLDFESADRFGAEILVGDDLELLHEGRKYGPRPADGAEVDALVLPEGILDRLGARALADGALQAEGEEAGGEPVHAPARGRPDGADDVARPRGRRPRVVDDLPLEVDGKRLAGFHQRHQPRVRRIARGVENARDANPVAGFERLDVAVAQRRPDLLETIGVDDHNVHPMSPLSPRGERVRVRGESTRAIPPSPRPSPWKGEGVTRVTESLPCADARGTRW